MAVAVLLSARVVTAGADLTNSNNKVEVDGEYAELDATTFGSGGSSAYAIGLGKASLSLSGLWDAGDDTKPDDRFAADLGTDQVPWSVLPNQANTAPAIGDLSYLLAAVLTKNTPGGNVGELMKYDVAATGDSPLVRGAVLLDPGTARTTTGSASSGVLLGAVSATQRIFCALHVLSVAGTAVPTFTAKLQSDDNAGFTSATDRITFTGATAVGGQWQSLAGAVTDTYWRISWTISGTNPSFLVLATAGIATP